MKAYRCDDGSIQMFRPEENMERLFNSAHRLSLPVCFTMEPCIIFKDKSSIIYLVQFKGQN